MKNQVWLCSLPTTKTSQYRNYELHHFAILTLPNVNILFWTHILSAFQPSLNTWIHTCKILDGTLNISISNDFIETIKSRLHIRHLIQIMCNWNPYTPYYNIFLPNDPFFHFFSVAQWPPIFSFTCLIPRFKLFFA